VIFPPAIQNYNLFSAKILTLLQRYKKKVLKWSTVILLKGGGVSSLVLFQRFAPLVGFFKNQCLSWLGLPLPALCSPVASNSGLATARLQPCPRLQRLSSSSLLWWRTLPASHPYAASGTSNIIKCEKGGGDNNGITTIDSFGQKVIV